MIDESYTFIEPKGFHIIKLASGSYLDTPLQQCLYQQDVGTIIQYGMVGQPTATVNGHYLLFLIFQIDIDEPKWSIWNMIVGNETLPTIHVHEILQLFGTCHIWENTQPLGFFKEVHQRFIGSLSPIDMFVTR